MIITKKLVGFKPGIYLSESLQSKHDKNQNCLFFVKMLRGLQEKSTCSAS